jgi:hypothetical protein
VVAASIRRGKRGGSSGIAEAVAETIDLPTADKFWANVLLEKVSEPAAVLGQTKLTPHRSLVRKLDFRRWIEVCNGILARENEGRTAALQENTAGDQRSGAMVSFLIELRVAEDADVNLRGYLKWIRGAVISVPPANRLHILSEVGEELLSRRRNVSAECHGVVGSAKQDEMIQLQQSLQSLVAEKINAVMNNRIQKLVRRKHVLPHDISKVIAAQFQGGIDRRKVTLHITQLLFNASQTQAQWLHYHLQQ